MESNLLLNAYEIGEMINQSHMLNEYIDSKKAMYACEEVVKCLKKLDGYREQLKEVERFGRHHPDFQTTRKTVRALYAELGQFEEVRRYQTAEEMLQEFLDTISSVLAKNVSESIKTPQNSMKGCGSGGSCGCAGKCGS